MAARFTVFPARRITAVGPVDQPVAEVEVKIDWLGQVVVKNFDVLAVAGV